MEPGTSFSASSTPGVVWKHHLAGDDAKTNAVIKAANPDITNGKIAG